MKKSTWRISFIAVLGVSLSLVAFVGIATAAVVYDIATDWSDVNNPNGVWRLYKAPGQLFTTNQADYWGSGGTGQHAWADVASPGLTHVPVWMKTISTSLPRLGGFVEAGTVIVHGAESERTGTEFTSVTWTSPLTGTVQISGGAWVYKGLARPMRWELRKNSVTLSLGDLTDSDPYTKDNPFNFANGSGGPSALQVAVVPNDVLELLVYRRSRSTYAILVATDFRITVASSSVGTCVELIQCQADLAAADQEIQAFEAQVNALTAQNAQLQQELQNSQSQLAELTTALTNGRISLTNDFRSVFNDPTFVIPGATPAEQYQNLITAILNLNKGRKQGIYVNLGGKPGN